MSKGKKRALIIAGILLLLLPTIAICYFLFTKAGLSPSKYRKKNPERRILFPDFSSELLQKIQIMP